MFVKTGLLSLSSPHTNKTHQGDHSCLAIAPILFSQASRLLLSTRRRSRLGGRFKALIGRY